MDAMTAAPDVTYDPLDIFAKGGLAEVVMMLFWRQRFDNPGFTVEVHPEDLKGFADCTAYLKVRPQIRVYRPGGVPAKAAIPATGNRRAVPGREAIPPKNYVVVQMVDEKGDAFVPIENNQDAFDRAEQAKQVQRTREGAKALAAQLESDVASQTFSASTIREAAAALRLLSVP